MKDFSKLQEFRTLPVCNAVIAQFVDNRHDILNKGTMYKDQIINI